jgi:hypothetical protein
MGIPQFWSGYKEVINPQKYGAHIQLNTVNQHYDNIFGYSAYSLRLKANQNTQDAQYLYSSIFT